MGGGNGRAIETIGTEFQVLGDDDETIRISPGKRLEHGDIEEGENGSGSADAEGEGQDSGDGEAGIPAKSAAGEADRADRLLEGVKAAGVAAFLLAAFETIHRNLCGAAGLDMAETAGDALSGFALDMEADFILEVLLGLIPAEER